MFLKQFSKLASAISETMQIVVQVVIFNIHVKIQHPLDYSLFIALQLRKEI